MQPHIARRCCLSHHPVTVRPLAVLGMAVFVFAGLGLYAGLTTQPRAVVDSSHSPLVVVCSTTQIADFARNIAGDRWQVRSILAPGQDPHLYEVRPGVCRDYPDSKRCGYYDFLLFERDQQEDKKFVATTNS